MPDGSVPRIHDQDVEGHEYPGRYLFHDVVNPGPDRDAKGKATGSPTEFVFVDRIEEVFDTFEMRRNIQDGHLWVTDPKHELAAFNNEAFKPKGKPAGKSAEDEDAAPPNDKPKKGKK
jgi:hypothetical protein